MRIVFKYLLAATLAVAFVATADAQGQRRGGGAGGQPPGGRGQGGMFGGGFGLTALMVNKSVLDELKVTDEQKEKLATWAREAGAKQREKMQELIGGGGDRPDPAKMQEAMAKISAEQLEEVSKVLKEEQTKRLKQVQLQIQGVNAFRTKEVQEGLKFSDEQKETVKEILAAMQMEQRELFQGGGGGGRPDPEALAEMNKKRTEMGKKYMEKVKAQLKDEQKKAYEEMTGKAFEYKPEAPRRRDN